MNRISKFLSLVLVCAASVAFGQTSLTQTTLSAAQGIGPASLSSGIQAPLSTTLSLASASGIQVAALGTQPVTYVYVDQELEGVISLVTGQTTIFNVLRAQGGTKAAYHNSGVMALIGTTTPQFGGFAGSGGFQQVDAPLNGGCNAANTAYTPWINVLTGAQWICSTLTNTWAPGWVNPLASPATWIQTGTVASAAGAVTPSGPYFNISGTSAITGFNIPVGFDTTRGGCFTVKPTGIFTWTSAGNIQTAGTVTATSTPVTFCWDAAALKWVPSRLS